MQHKVKKTRLIQQVHDRYKSGLISAESASKMLVGKCNFNCLTCSHSFVHGGWCSTMANDNCMYYEKVILRAVVTNDVDKDAQMRSYIEKAKELYRAKGFVTLSLIQRHLRVTNNVASKIIESM